MLNIVGTKVYSLEEFAEMIGTTIRQVREMRYRGTAPKAFKIGRQLFMAEEDIKAWLDERRKQEAKKSLVAMKKVINGKPLESNLNKGVGCPNCIRRKEISE